MKTEISTPAVIVKDTGTAKGRGVFAARALLSGEVVEEAPVILINMAFVFLPNEIKDMVYRWIDPEQPLLTALALGYGSLYNHDEPANLRYKMDPENKLIRYKASRDIAAGEELTISYSQGNDTDKFAWFEKRNLTPILSSESN